MCWRRLQYAFSVTIFRLARRPEDILQDVLKTSWKTKNWYAEDVLKTCLEDVLKTCLEDVLKTCLEEVLKTCLESIFKTSWRQKKWGYLYLTNPNVCVSNKSIFHKSISSRIQGEFKIINSNPIISIFLYFEIQVAFLFLELISLMIVWCCEISYIQIRHCRKGESLKAKFYVTY